MILGFRDFEGPKETEQTLRLRHCYPYQWESHKPRTGAQPPNGEAGSQNLHGLLGVVPTKG